MDSEWLNPGIRLLEIRTSPQDMHGRWNLTGLAAPYWRLYWHNSAGAFIHYAGREYAVGAEKLFLISPDTDFSTSCPGHPRQYHVHFVIGGPYSNVKPGILEFPCKDESLRGLFKRCFENSRDENGNERLKATLAFKAVFCALELIPEKLLPTKRLDARVVSAMKSLEPDEPPRSNKALAANAKMSRNAFLRLFRRDTGTSPQLYNRKLRIEEACRMLHYSGMDVKEIAWRTGFCNRYHFSKIFKDLRGMGPAEFRRRRAEDFE